MDIRKILDIVTEAEKPLAKGMKVMSPSEFLQSQGIEPKSSEEGVAEGSGKNVVKSVKVGNFRHDLVDTGMGWQVRIYNGGELYDTGMSKNSEQKGLAALEDAVAYTEKQTRTKRQGVAEDNDTIYKNWRKDVGTDYDTTLKLVDKDYDPNKPRNVADELAKMNKKLKNVTEGTGNWYVRVKGKVLKDKKFNAIPFSSKETARQQAFEIHRKKQIPLEMIKLTQSWMDSPEQGVAEGSAFDIDTTGYTKNDMSVINQEINQIKKIRAKLLKIPGFVRKVSDEKSQLRLAEKIFNLMKRGQTFDSALVLVQKQGVAEARSSRNSPDDYDLDSHTSFIPKGRISDLDFDLRHISHAQNFGALQDALDGQFGPDTRKWLENQMMKIGQEHGLHYDNDKDQIIEILMNQLVEKYGLTEGSDIAYVVSYFEKITGDKGETTVSAISPDKAAEKVAKDMGKHGYPLVVYHVRRAESVAEGIPVDAENVETNDYYASYYADLLSQMRNLSYTDTANIKNNVKRGLDSGKVSLADLRMDILDLDRKIKNKKGVAEGAPELLKQEMPLVRHIEKELEQYGYMKGTAEYDEKFKHAIAFYRKFGNIDAIKQGVAEGSDNDFEQAHHSEVERYITAHGTPGEYRHKYDAMGRAHNSYLTYPGRTVTINTQQYGDRFGHNVFIKKEGVAEAYDIDDTDYIDTLYQFFDLAYKKQQSPEHVKYWMRLLREPDNPGERKFAGKLKNALKLAKDSGKFSDNAQAMIAIAKAWRKKHLQTDGLPDELSEAEKLKGVSQKPFPKDELIKYLDRVVGEPVLDKEGKPKLDKKGNPQFKSLKTKTDKYKFPYIHRSNVPIVNQDGQKYDLDKLASMFTERPSKILKQNEKMQHSDGTASQFYNVGLPALIGLAVDEDNKEFVVINTCPGAGNCKLVCYAMKGGYIQYPASNLSQTRLLNFLYNDPDGFMGMLENEIREFEAKNKKKNIKTIIRWHDAGDFFSPEYLDKAYNLAKKFPDVDFYAYTKLASVAQGDKPDNFKINFSMGAQPSQEKKIDFAKTKNSRIVPEVLFADLLEKDKAGKWQYKNPQAEQAVKDRIAAKYSLDPKSIITYDEMMDIPVGKEKGKWNVIVKPGDGDDAANRNDVLSSLLLIH